LEDEVDFYITFMSEY